MPLIEAVAGQTAPIFLFLKAHGGAALMLGAQRMKNDPAFADGLEVITEGWKPPEEPIGIVIG